MSVGRFLLATIDGGGTLPPEMGLAAELVGRGHSVEVLSDPTVRASALAAGCGFMPWPTAPSVSSDAGFLRSAVFSNCSTGAIGFW